MQTRHFEHVSSSCPYLYPTLPIQLSKIGLLSWQVSKNVYTLDDVQSGYSKSFKLWLVKKNDVAEVEFNPYIMPKKP